MNSKICQDLKKQLKIKSAHYQVLLEVGLAYHLILAGLQT